MGYVRAPRWVWGTSAAVFCLPAVLAGTPLKLESLPTAVAPVVVSAPEVDGRLTDPAWQHAVALGPFVTMTGEKTEHETAARLLYTSDTLFIGVEARFASGATLKLERKTRDSDVYQDESVEIFVDPGLSFSKYYHFLVNAANVQRDEFCDKDATPLYDEAWDANWQSATARGDTSWTAEIALPLNLLQASGTSERLLGLNVCRNDSTAQENACWSPTNSGFHQPTRFGVIGLGPSGRSTLGLDVKHPSEARIGSFEAAVECSNQGTAPRSVRVAVMVGNERGCSESDAGQVSVPAKGHAKLSARYDIAEGGVHAVVVVARDADGAVLGVRKSVRFLPEKLTRRYGRRLETGYGLGLWWAPSTHKIHRWQTRPDRVAGAVRLSAAGRELEAAQIVLRPDRDTTVELEVTDLSRRGSRIPARHLHLLQVEYVQVKVPTDGFGWADDWPDPLPPVTGPVACPAGVNQPFWLLVHVPPGTGPGTYRGEVRITPRDGTTARVPVELQVYDFSLTPETHTRTAYGVRPAYAFLGVKDKQQRREVYDLYMQSCRDHRISPYSPMAHYPMDIKVQAPKRRLSYGKLALEFEIGQQYPWKLYWGGEPIANQRTSMTHFEKEGVGWKGTGVSWPYVDAIQSVKEVSASDTMRVLEVVAAHTGSGPAQRSFRLTFRFYVPSGDNWFAHRLTKMESTDPVEVTVRHYYNLPRTELKAQQVASGRDFAAWAGDELGFGMLCLGEGFGALEIKEGATGVTVPNPPPQPFKIREGGTHDGWGPLVVYFVSEGTSSEALASRAETLRRRIDPNAPERYVPSEPETLSVDASEDYSITHDFSVFDEGARRYLDEFRFNGFNVRCMPGQIAGHARFTGDFARFHEMMCRPVVDHLRENGWLRKAYSYWIDEPNEEQYGTVTKGMGLLGWHCPGLTRLLTEQPEPELADAVDLWVPVLNAFRPGSCGDRQLAGDEVWWYVCCGPRAPYPNNFVDHPAINHRIRFWMAEKYGVTGSLYWATTFYGQKPDGSFRNPWEDGMTYRPNGGYWGNGDGMLLYPACRQKSEPPVIGGPVVSMRWELLRDGIEDREYFWLLRREADRLRELRATASSRKRRAVDQALAVADGALQAPERLVTSLTKYTRNVEELLDARHDLAQAISACRAVR